MNNIQNIFQKYGSQYLSLFGDRMPLAHKKVIKAITECRSGSFGTVVYGCDDCHTLHPVPCCCGNRHCPNCQYGKTDNWLQKQMEKLLPTNYFLITVTLPDKLREVVRSNQSIAYKAMFSCAYDSLKKLAKDKRFVGSDRIGCLAVLHTWGGMLQYHPHLHLVIPAGALSKEGDKWLPSRHDLFVHTKPLAEIFKAKLRDALNNAELTNKIHPSVWEKPWVVDSQAVGQGQNSLRYLSKYVFRVAISNNRIKSIDNHQIKFSYKDRLKKKWQTMSLNAMEFIRRFLQHVLPSGFMKIRHYGFLNANSSVSIEKICELISMIYDVIRNLLPEIILPEKNKRKCSHCGQNLKYIFMISPLRTKGASG